MYGRDFYDNVNCIDCDHIKSCSLCYSCINCTNCYNCNYLQDSDNCSDCNYGFYLRGCKNCIGSTGLIHKEFYIFNQPYTREEYFKKLETLSLEDIKNGFKKTKRLTPRVNLTLINCENCEGNCIYNSRNIYESYDVHDCQDSGYLLESQKLKDCYDVSVLENSELCYQIANSYILNNCNFCNFCMNCSDSEFCECLIASEFCFGCISLHHKKYYILNQPYSKEEYFKVTAEIKVDLKARNIYGKMLIPSTFPEDETVAVWEKM